MSALGSRGFFADAGTVLRCFRFVLIAHVLKLLLCLPAAVFVGRLVHGELAHSLEAERFAAALEPALLMELVSRLGTALRAGGLTLAASLPVAALALIFIDGAMLRVFADRVSGSSAGSFFEAGGRAFMGLLLLLPFGLVISLLLGLAPAYGLHRFAAWLTAEWRDEGLVFATRAAGFLLGLFSFLYVRASYGLARASAASGEPIRRSLSTFARALARPGGAFAAVIPWMLLGALCTLGLSLLDVRIGRSGPVLVVLGFFVQQGSGLVRTLCGTGSLAALTRVHSLGRTE